MVKIKLKNEKNKMKTSINNIKLGKDIGYLQIT